VKVFIIIWIGQLVSRIGTGMTRFALLIWAYQQTGEATTVALLGFFAFVPLLLVGPFAGVWVDRLDRRRIMLLSDVGAGMMTMGLLLLFSAGNLHLWHLYLAQALTGVFEAFQAPAYTAVASTLLPRAQYTRANGLRSLAEFGAQVAGPVLGGLLLGWVGIAGVMLVDLTTLLVAVVTLLLVRVPAVTGAGQLTTVSTASNFWQELLVGFRTIWQSPGLLGFALMMTAVNFFASLTWFSILPAMVLARSGQNELALASVQSAMGLGGVLGGILVSVWGGPRRKIHGVLLGIAASFLFGDIPLAIGRSLPVWVMSAAAGAFCIPLIISCYEAIWQSKVHPAMQGRVFSVRNTMSRTLTPAGYLLGGVLADRVLEPAMAVDGWLVGPLGWLVGTGPGTGMALMFIGSAVCAIFMCLGAYLIPAIRHIEGNLPDHDFVVVAASVSP
jgi:MFS transporter, DHA3 family, macrolide efflux protein